MNHLINRGGHHSSDVLLFALKDGMYVWATGLGSMRQIELNNVAFAAQKLSVAAKPSILLITLEPEEGTPLLDMETYARNILLGRVIDDIAVPEHVSIWISAEEHQLPGLFADEAVLTAAPLLVRGVQSPKRRLGDPTNYVASPNP